MTKLCVCERWCVTKLCVDGAGRSGRERDTESKTRTPHKDVGKKQIAAQKDKENTNASFAAAAGPGLSVRSFTKSMPTSCPCGSRKISFNT